MKLLTLLADADISSVFGNGLSLGEKGALSLKMILMGMGTVFAVLFIIWLVLTLFRLVMDAVRKKGKDKEPSRNTDPVPACGTVDATDDRALVAVISAAVAAYREAESGASGRTVPFRVVSFNRSGSGPWKKDGDSN